MDKKICDKECSEIRKDVKVRNIDFLSILVVEYQVDNKTFELK